ncbi:MAG: argininosuccinate lyase [Bacteroidales bacterium]
MSTLWSKDSSADSLVESFTVGKDRELDLRLAYFDVIGSLAHIKMLQSISLLTEQELSTLTKELNIILDEIKKGSFVLEEDVEDIHSQIELTLTRRVGEVGKKIHSGRSRNDQVLTDVKLYLKWEIDTIKEEVHSLFKLLQKLSEQHKEVLIPGYTHAQIAMPSSFGLWFGAYAEALIDDIYMLAAARRIVDQNPLGSAAGYGSSFPLDREMTTEQMGFGTLTYNSIAAQLGRGKSEKSVAAAISSVAFTLNKFACDAIMYMCGNFGFISFPDELTTGSSIMPHKKNPDVWEIIRGRCNMIDSVSNEISLLTRNLSHGYHRDFQLLKEILFPALDSIHEVINMTSFMLEHIKVNGSILDDSKYEYLFTVEEVNRRVLDGVPFRDAYKEVGREVASGEFKAQKKVVHTHIGSIGNLSNLEIKHKMEKALEL